MKRYATIFLFIAFTTALSGSLFADAISDSMNNADKYLNSGQYLEAMGAYQEIAERASDPNLKAKIILRIGDIYSQFLNNCEKALEYYAILKKHYPQSPYTAIAYFNSGMILYQNDFYSEALNQFKIYCEKYPRGEKRDVAEFMIDTCFRQTPQQEKKTARKIPVDENIRVLLMAGVRNIQVDAPSSLEVWDMKETAVMIRDKTVGVEIDKGAIKINGVPAPSEGIVINGSACDVLSLNGAQYRGKFRIQSNPKGGLDVVNILPLDAYLYGVIPKEMPSQWFPEALKAQAIAARTYALYQMEKSRKRSYDITATTDCQAYGGMFAEREPSNRAVDETSGIALFYNDQLILAYFHAHSGGVTEDAQRVWKVEIPYLKAVRDDYSLKAPNNVWKQTFSLDDIRKALNKSGGAFGPIKKIIPHEMSPTGRVIKIRLTHGGKETIMNANDFRMKMDPALIKSTFFDILQQGREVTFTGKGYGHGVGMSQWGAYVMAGEGFTWHEILQYYYQGVDIRTF